LFPGEIGGKTKGTPRNGDSNPPNQFISRDFKKKQLEKKKNWGQNRRQKRQDLVLGLGKKEAADCNVGSRELEGGPTKGMGVFQMGRTRGEPATRFILERGGERWRTIWIRRFRKKKRPNEVLRTDR